MGAVDQKGEGARIGASRSEAGNGQPHDPHRHAEQKPAARTGARLTSLLVAAGRAKCVFLPLSCGDDSSPREVTRKRDKPLGTLFHSRDRVAALVECSVLLVVFQASIKPFLSNG